MNLNNLFESDFNKKPQQGVVEGGPYDLPGIDYDRPGDTPPKRRSAPSDYPYSQEQDDVYFNDIFRKKREAAKKAEQDKGSLTEFAEKPENGPGSDDYEDLLFHLAWEMWSEAGDSAQAERKLSLLGWKPEFGDDYTAMVLYKIGNDDDHRQYTIDEFEEYGGSGDDQGVAEGSDAKVNGQDVDVNVVVEKLQQIAAQAKQQIQNSDYDQQKRYATTIRDRALQALKMIEQGGNTPEAAHAAFKYMQTGKQGVAEADKKKDDDLEPQVRDVALQRAISRAKADFPTAGTGIEALAKDFMRSQDQDSRSLDQIRQLDRRQDQMLDQINQLDKDQTQEINNLEKNNSSLKSRLQQIQSVNSRLANTLASMTGQKKEKSGTGPDTTPSTPTQPVVTKTTSSPKSKSAKAKKQSAPNAMKSTAAQLATPKADPMAAMTNRITKGDSSILNPKQVAFDYGDNVLPATTQRQRNPSFATARRDATDIDARYGQELASRVKKDVTDVGKTSASYPDAERLRAMVNKTLEPTDENKEQKSEPPEVDYDDPKWDAMVSRVGKLAKEGPRKTVYDPVKRVYKTVPVNK